MLDYEIRPKTLCCSLGSAHVLASLSCFMDMESVIEMMENKESNHLIMDRITSGKDLHPEIEKILIFDTDIPIKRYFHRGSYMKWNFGNNNELWQLGYRRSHIKNLYVNPNFGKEGVHS